MAVIKEDFERRKFATYLPNVLGKNKNPFPPFSFSTLSQARDVILMSLIASGDLYVCRVSG